MTIDECLADLPWRLRQLRKARGWLQVDLAAELDLTRASICNWETGVKTPSLRTACRLAEALGVTLDTLALGR